MTLGDAVNRDGFLLVADLHFHEFSEFARQDRGRNSRLNECVDSLKYVATHANAHKLVTIVLGDVFHVKGLVHANVHEAFCEALSAFQQPVWILPGNHDQFDDAGNVHSLLPYQGYRGKVAVLDDVGKIHEEHFGSRIWFVPAMKDPKFQEAIDKCCGAARDFATDNPGIPKLLLTHGIINGALAGGKSEHVIEGGAKMDAKALGLFEWVFAGDIHGHKVDDNRVYVGSLLKHKFDDVGHYGGFIHVDITKAPTWNWVPNPHSPVFVDLQDSKKAPKKIIEQALADHAAVMAEADIEFTGRVYGRVTVDTVSRKEQWQEAAEAMDVLLRVTVRGGPELPSGAQRAAIVEPDAKDEDVMGAYINHVAQSEAGLGDLDGKKLLAVGKELLE